MQNILLHFAEAEHAESADLFGTLGIEWTALILQIVSFAILVFILAKFIYPPIAAMLDRHDKKIEDAMKAAKEAQEQASESEAKTAAILEKSRREAEQIVESAKKESAEIIIKAEEDASIRANAIVSNARAGLEREIEQARTEIRKEVKRYTH